MVIYYFFKRVFSIFIMNFENNRGIIIYDDDKKLLEHVNFMSNKNGTYLEIF